MNGLIDALARTEVAGKRLLGSAVQLGHVVRDIDAAANRYAQLFGVGPFILVEDTPEGEFLFHGQPTPVRLRVAISYLGDTQIELIEQTNDAPSPYVDFLRAGREGLHHFGFWCDDHDAARRHLRELGFKEFYSAQVGGAQRPAVYCQPPQEMGFLVELCEQTPAKIAYYAAIAGLARSWDGKDPIRRYRRRADFAEEVGIASPMPRG